MDTRSKLYKVGDLVYHKPSKAYRFITDIIPNIEFCYILDYEFLGSVKQVESVSDHRKQQKLGDSLFPAQGNKNA